MENTKDINSQKTTEKNTIIKDIRAKVQEAEESIQQGRHTDMDMAIAWIRDKYGL